MPNKHDEAVRLAKINAINDAGAREERGGTVIQMAKRSEQLNGIAYAIANMMGRAIETGSLDPGAPRVVRTCLLKDDAHRLNGYAEQLLIISNELRKAGK